MNDAVNDPRTTPADAEREALALALLHLQSRLHPALLVDLVGRFTDAQAAVEADRSRARADLTLQIRAQLDAQLYRLDPTWPLVHALHDAWAAAFRWERAEKGGAR